MSKLCPVCGKAEADDFVGMCLKCDKHQEQEDARTRGEIFTVNNENKPPQKPTPSNLDELRRWRDLGSSTGRLEALGITLPDAPELPADVAAAFEAGRKGALKRAK